MVSLPNPRSRPIAGSRSPITPTASASSSPSCGAVTPIPTPPSTSTSTSAIWSRHEGGPVSDDHGHHPTALTEIERRARALEELLTEKGIVDSAFIDAVAEAYAHDIGPMNGARVVARAWVDPDYKLRLLADGTAAIAELGFGGAEGDHIEVVENTPAVHNVVVCTLCSCYPWPVLGLPPNCNKTRRTRPPLLQNPRLLLGRRVAKCPEKVESGVWTSGAE